MLEKNTKQVNAMIARIFMCCSAEEENRMKTRVLSSVSHEIRTPIHAILGMAEVARREEMSPKLRRYLGIIRSSAAGLLELLYAKDGGKV